MLRMAMVLTFVGVCFQVGWSQSSTEEQYTNNKSMTDRDVELLHPVKNPPPVQMLVPGFAVRELPLEMTNVNNLRYRSDGKLVALCYNGNVWVLSDRDGDGYEDTKHLFFENKGALRGPIGLAVVPAGHALLQSEAGAAVSPQARGIVVASKGKISALLDLDGDDVAEQERIIASGWQEIPPNVDAIGVAIHPDDGAIYFGLGAAAYNNAYLLNDAGKSQFDLTSQRGTIQRIAPDLKTRTIVCTGIRFTIGLAFDKHRQLFASDQEGATWLANGNPFDELLHIQSGKHYGFPPRHPRHLPKVFDEPSVFDYGPQHQSTCGIAFNEPFFENGSTFGPAMWRGDLFVCGQSRGKLYRTRLVQDVNGDYVADNHLIACLSMLTVDCCVTPRGELLLACHSGGPDWGTGPSGIGRIFSVRYVGSATPQPIRIWPQSPHEVRVAFDGPLKPNQITGLVEQSQIVYGEYVAAGDRFESIRPGYAVTKMQQTLPRRKLPIYSASVTPDQKTLILSTATHRWNASYALTLPGLGRQDDVSKPGDLPQVSQIDLSYSLSGVSARWQGALPSQAILQCTLPHLNTSIATTLLLNDADIEELNRATSRPGNLLLTTAVDLRGLFLPVTQPGSSLDFEAADDDWIAKSELVFSSRRPFSLTIGDSTTAVPSSLDGQSHSCAISVDRHSQKPISVVIAMGTGVGDEVVDARWRAIFSDGSQRSGLLAQHRFVLPWADNTEQSVPELPNRQIPELAGGNWGRGKQIFHSEQAKCAKCHVRNEKNVMLAPDLANLVHRDYESVLRDVAQPSFAINPDFVTHVLNTKDGRILTGSIRNQADTILVADKEGKVTSLHRDDIEQMKTASVSNMPDGLLAQLGPNKTRDLLTYLLLPPPSMPLDGNMQAPPPRTVAEVEAVLAGSETINDHKPLKILLVAGKKDHGPGEHDYPAWLNVWSELLSAAPDVQIDTASDWPTDQQLKSSDTIVFYQKGTWNQTRQAAIDSHLARGGGLVLIHWAIEGGSQAKEMSRRIGLASNAKLTKYRHGPLDLAFASAQHPITRNFQRAAFLDESYWQLQGNETLIRNLATTIEQDRPRPVFWTLEPDRGRVFVSIMGHYSWTFDDPLFRVILLRGMAWASDQSVDRFNELVTPGARMTQ